MMVRTLRVSSLVVPFWLLFCVLVPAAQAAEPEADPRSLIEARHALISHQLNERPGVAVAEIREEIRNILSSFVDFDRFARRALKRYYPDLKKRRQESYVTAFSSLVQATYLRRIKPGNRYQMLFRGDPQLAEGKGLDGAIEQKARINTTMRSGAREIEVDYLLYRNAAGIWRAYDIVIDQVSMARNYRKQFYGIMKKSGYAGLMERIRTRTEEKESEG